MQKSIVLILAVCLVAHIGNSQEVLGTIFNTNKQPIANAHISVLNSSQGTSTNTLGEFKLTLSPTEHTLHITALGYQAQYLKVNSTNQDTTLSITMLETVTRMDEVIVSASREKQKRADIPASIGIITQKLIEDTKPIGIEQMVNQIPGVYMSTSRASGNEQHFMTVRSPISTRSLFLYLEDGLQIRPTSVFNHNALLEMNDIAYRRIEVLKGPASSIYGSEAIGGSFNFLTKNPTPQLSGSLSFQKNDLGLNKYTLELSDQASDKFGFYLGAQAVNRNDGPIDHSDYEKKAITFKTVYNLTSRTTWTSVLDLIDYRSDMAGSLSQDDYERKNYESDQTFTQRDAFAFRLRNTFAVDWNSLNKTTFNILFRNNDMNQNPSYRVRQFRENGQLTGFGSGEVNTNSFQSIMGLIQHKKNFDFKKSALIIGGTLDYSPQKYIANTIDVTVDPESGKNVDFITQENDFILNYEADILNYAGFLQYEIEPLDDLKLTAALRFDRFEYTYNNNLNLALEESSIDTYYNWSPKVGLNYNLNRTTGFYANYSQGFTPPQVSTLYRNRNELRNIEPSIYNNYEIGTYYSPTNKLSFDAALYLLEGKNTLITLRDNQDIFYNTNAGKTRSYGIEYGVQFTPINELTLRHSGSYARHRYIKFFDSGVDYSDTDRETAPNLLGTTTITYHPLQNFTISAEHELVGKYNTSFENQVINEDGSTTTATYSGHNIFNLRASYRIKFVEIWAQYLNIFNDLYSTRASYNSFSSENTYVVGNPRAIHAGIRLYF